MSSLSSNPSNELEYRITMHPVKNGDCFFIEFFQGDNAFNMMIDSGPATAWETLDAFLDKLSKDKKKIDILLLTHYCADHIEGALALLEEERYRNLVGEVWYNGLEHIAPLDWKKNNGKHKDNQRAFRRISERYRTYRLSRPNYEGSIAAKQSISLSLTVKAHAVKSNTEAITNKTQRKKYGKNNEIIIDFLLPTQEKLKDLLRPFEDELVKQHATPETTDLAIEAFERLILAPQANHHEGEIAASRPTKADRSPANASSISIIIRFNGYKFLFPGDAVDEDIIKALENWLKDNPNENLIFDIVKLPHHGSVKNCWELLEQKQFRGRSYLVSTDGSYYHHPSSETIDQLRKLSFDEPYTVYFNHQKIMDDYSAPRPNDNPNCTFLFQTEIKQERT